MNSAEQREREQRKWRQHASAYAKKLEFLQVVTASGLLAPDAHARLTQELTEGSITSLTEAIPTFQL